MNPGIYYFYEYIHSRRLRNVGFLKFSVRYGKYIIRLSIKGIPVAAQQKVSLSAILSENKSVSSSTIGELTCGNQNISAQFPLPETPSLHESTVGSIVGFFLTLPGGNLIISTIPGITVNADTIAALTRKKIPEDCSDSAKSISSPEVISDTTEQPSPSEASSEPAATVTSPEISSEEATQVSSPEASSEETTQVSSLEASSEEAVQVSSPEVSSDEEKKIVFSEDGANAEALSATADSDTETSSDVTPEAEPSPRPLMEAESLPYCETAVPDSSGDTPGRAKPVHSGPCGNLKKIRRSDLSILPRRHWNLANNSFLLHGYHNYNHLLLVEEDGHYWLGVPGIYDAREARAAELFGFPQFTRSCHQQLSLSKDEYNETADFGYWCRYIR